MSKYPVESQIKTNKQTSKISILIRLENAHSSNQTTRGNSGILTAFRISSVALCCCRLDMI